MNRLLASLLVISMAMAVAARVPTYVLEPGLYEKLVIDDGEVWLGVYPAGDQAEVRECKLRVRKIANAEEYQSEATRVEATPGEALFLLKGAKSVKPGRVTSLYTKGEAYPSSVPLTLAGKHYVIETVEAMLSDGFRIKQLILKVEGRKMVLGDCPRRDAISPVWAGDLDGDGRLDVYVRIEHHSYAVEQLLFLSSADATGKAITARAARLSIRKFE